MNLSLRAAAGVVLTLVGGCGGTQTTSSTDIPEPEDVELLTIDGVPEGLELSAFGEFPELHPNTADEPYSLTLRRLENGGVFAVMERPTPEGEANDVAYLKRVGPRQLAAFELIDAGVHRLVISRDVPRAKLKALALDPDTFASTVLARQPIASVPGIGSLAIPPRTDGYAISWVATDQAPGENQRSVVIGSYVGTAADLVVMVWWYGSGVTANGMMTAEVPAFTAAGDPQDVPTAYYAATVVGAQVVVIRAVLVELTALDILSSVRAPTTQEAAAIQAVRVVVP